MAGSYGAAFYKGATVYNTHQVTMDGSGFAPSVGQPFPRTLDYDSMQARDAAIRVNNDLSVDGGDGSNSQRASLRPAILNDTNLP